ncbi:MAG: NADH-quinone oxidoreductase subunit J [Bacteroidota bacterium]|nr:NADH-quinone oxidoreductase subunit J [Bacteroidota bacterium]
MKRKRIAYRPVGDDFSPMLISTSYDMSLFPGHTSSILTGTTRSIIPPARLVTFSTLVFLVSSATAVVTGILVITRSSALHSALFLILNFLALAVLYLSLQAQFIAVIQVIVYAGAIMVLVLFVIMLLNLREENHRCRSFPRRHLAGILLGAGILLIFVQAIIAASVSYPSSLARNAAEIGTSSAIGDLLYRSFVFPFEMASILLLAAIVGAVVLAKKRFP